MNHSTAVEGSRTQDSLAFWRAWVWKQKLPLLWLLNSVLLLSLGIMYVILRATQSFNAAYIQHVFASDMMVTGSYIAAFGNNLLSTGAMSIWLLVSTLAVGGGVLWLRRRFSLAALLLTIVIAAGLASVPKVLMQDQALHTGCVSLRESAFTGGKFLNEKELADLQARLVPEEVFARLPVRMREELTLKPGMLRSVRVEPSKSDATERETLLKVDMREDLSPEQSATLFHAVSAQALEIVKELYAPRMQSGIQGSPGGFLSHPNNTRSRFAEYEKEWEAGKAK